MFWPEFAVLFVVSIVATIALTPVARKIAIKFDAIDYPSARRVNMLPIPRMGGIAIFGGMVVALAVMVVGVVAFGWPDPLANPVQDVFYPGVFAGVVVIFIVGVVDDITNLSPKMKLLGQIVAACIVVASGLLFSAFNSPFGGDRIEFGWFAYPLTVFYLVAFANVINLIDGLDGLASGITGISAMAILVFALIMHRYDAALFSIILIGVCIGFLKSNFHPASIFMGDSGSLTLGFTLGLISLFAVARSTLIVSLLVPVLAAGVPIMDTLFAIIRRKREHRPIDEADKGHIHHRLMRAGFSQRTTVLLMWGWTALLSLGAILVTRVDYVTRIPIFFVMAVVTVYAILKLHLLGDALRHHFHPRINPAEWRRAHKKEAETKDSEE